MRGFVAGVAQLVERNLAKVEVASSRLVSRSKSKGKRLFKRFPLSFLDLLAEWQSGYAAACKAVYLGSIPGSASNYQKIALWPVSCSRISAAAPTRAYSANGFMSDWA